MEIVINKTLMLNAIIAFIALLFMILISIQITLNKILKETKEIRIQKTKSDHNRARSSEND